jgi:hypothetical protein
MIAHKFFQDFYQMLCRPCEKSGLLTLAAGEARISSDFCHLSSTLALALA